MALPTPPAKLDGMHSMNNNTSNTSREYSRRIFLTFIFSLSLSLSVFLPCLFDSLVSRRGWWRGVGGVCQLSSLCWPDTAPLTSSLTDWGGLQGPPSCRPAQHRGCRPAATCLATSWTPHLTSLGLEDWRTALELDGFIRHQTSHHNLDGISQRNISFLV